ncbi:hypothetical protein TNCV_4474931 [Trichonephila clavipes]|nr:hypothetical protein TNCV_4474931 [Trichonephila clavipes]
MFHSLESHQECSVEFPAIKTVLWLVMLTAIPMILDSNPGEAMHIYKCLVHLLHGGTLNSRPGASPFVRLVEGQKRLNALTTPRMLSLKIRREPSKAYLPCMVLKATDNIKLKLAVCHDEFRGHRSDYVKQMFIHCDIFHHIYIDRRGPQQMYSTGLKSGD